MKRRASGVILAAWLVVGCARQHRYVNRPEQPEEALAAVQREATERGLKRIGHRASAEIYVVPEQRDPTGSRSVSRDDASSCTGWPYFSPERCLFVRAFPATDGGSVVEIAGANLAITEEMFPGVPSRRFDPFLVPRKPLVTDLNIRVGVGSSSENGVYLRIEPAFSVGWRVLEWGERSALTGVRTGLIPGLGVGLAMDARGTALRPELHVELDRQRAVDPAPGRTIPLGPRSAVGLSIAALIGLDDDRGAVEIGADAHVWPWGGVFARAGYELRSSSNTYFVAGVQTDGVATVVAAGVSLLIIGIVSLGDVEWSIPCSRCENP
ncbi:MAG: hypothetical protein SFX73_00560 [Kofleriaceae bacterium]|nr:hypothetical protein [Kofleriaceae bacterium]